MNNDNCLELKNIEFSFNKDKPIFNNFSMNVKRNSFTVIMGENGCGKSTLLNIIAGLKYENHGTIFLNNKDITGTITQQRDLAYVFQKAVLYPHLTVYQNIYFALSYYGLTNEEKDIKTKTILKQIKMSKYVNMKPRHLSQGQKQKISLAKAMVREPSLLLLDEPFAYLDKISQSELMNILIDLKESISTTVIFVSHNFESISNIADRLIVLKEGAIYFDGTPFEALNKEDSYLNSLL